MAEKADVLVVGAGPAGSVAAAALARSGLAVVLAGTADLAGEYDVLLTGQALGELASAGLDGVVPLHPVERAELLFGPSVRRVVADSGAAVCQRDILERALRTAALEAGARFVPGLVTTLAHGDEACEAVIERRACPLRVIARHVVIAAGQDAGALGADVVPPSPGLVCARRYSGLPLGGTALLAMPAPDGVAGGQQVTCIWVLPGGAGTVTVGTAHFAADGARAEAEALLDAALAELTRIDPRFASLRQAGAPYSGPLNAGFTPGLVARAGYLLAGDAAGLVNPFSGEGLSGAIHSGLLAVRVIAARPARPAAARRRYARRLATTYVGCFETTRHAAQRYHLTWRMLAAGASSDHPLFAKARRVLLLPDGPRGVVTGSTMRLADLDLALVGPFLAACDEVTISLVREEWPFLARLALAGGSLGQPKLRPAVLFFAALRAGGLVPPVTVTGLGAAIELAFLGATSLFGTPGPAAAARGVDWARATTLLAGDFVLAQASRLVAEHCPDLSWSFADWLAELAAVRANRLDPGGQVAAGSVYASLLEFPARIGALLGGAPPPVARAVREFGRQCGYAFGHTEDVLAVRGARTRLDTTLDAMLHDRVSAIPRVVAGRLVSQATLARDEQLRSLVLADATEACAAARARALNALEAIAEPMAARVLRGFVTAVTEPTEWHRNDRGAAAIAPTINPSEPAAVMSHIHGGTQC